MKRGMIRAVVVLLLSFHLSHLAASQSQIWKPLDLPILDQSKLKPTVPKEMVASLKINGSSIILEQTSLKTVQEQFGGTIGQEGDAVDYFEWLCLTGVDASQRWVLWLEAGEIDGGNVAGFQLRQLTPGAKLDDRCGIVKGGPGVNLPKSLHLGMSDSEIVNNLGKATSRKGSTFFYLHEHKEILRHEPDPYVVDNSIVLVLREGKLWALQVWKQTQN